jgi:hypothetical protein
MKVLILNRPDSEDLPVGNTARVHEPRTAEWALDRHGERCTT